MKRRGEGLSFLWSYFYGYNLVMILSWLIGLFIFILGLVWGSFLNVVIYRTVKGKSPFEGRSKCPHCGTVIGWWQNIPLLSFVLLGGRCFKCKKKISWQYPLVEFLSGVLFLWWWMIGKTFFVLSGSPWQIVQPAFWLIVGMLLLVVAVTDLVYGIIPDIINLILFSLALVYRLVLVSAGEMQVVDAWKSVVVAVVITLFFWFLRWITREKGFGMGDVKLAPALGLILGWPKGLVGVMIAFISGAVVALVLMMVKKKKFGQTLPFGPFLVLGTAMALWWGETIWQWYWQMM